VVEAMGRRAGGPEGREHVRLDTLYRPMSLGVPSDSRYVAPSCYIHARAPPHTCTGKRGEWRTHAPKEKGRGPTYASKKRAARGSRGVCVWGGGRRRRRVRRFFLPSAGHETACAAHLSYSIPRSSLSILLADNVIQIDGRIPS
jgi:hypothetical protein